jgi:ribonucleoside-diphosphate reductase beta chain
MTVLNREALELQSEPLFFGKAQGIARFDNEKYPIFSKLRKLQKSLFWNPEEINLQKDSIDFKSLQPHEKHIFTKNIAYQILLDSVQERAPLYAFLPHVTHPELETCIITWAFFEMIHSESYQWILRNLYPNPSEVFDSILEDTAILERASSIVKYYDDFIECVSTFKEQKGSNFVNDEMRKRLYLALIAVYALEGIRFQVSFAVSFSFAKLGVMTGNGSIIKLISKDEAQHVAVVSNILKILKSDENFSKVVKNSESDVYQIIDDVVLQEKEWAKYLFKDGVIVGLNQQILCHYVEFNANKRMKSIGLRPVYPTTNDPLPWISTYINGEEIQTAPQETEITDYLVNIIDTTIDEASLIEF